MIDAGGPVGSEAKCRLGEPLHALGVRLLGAGGEQDHAGVRRRVAAKARASAEQHGAAGRVVVRAGDRRRSADVDHRGGDSPPRGRSRSGAAAACASTAPSADEQRAAEGRPHHVRAWSFCFSRAGKRRPIARGSLGVEDDARMGGVVVGDDQRRCCCGVGVARAPRPR